MRYIYSIILCLAFTIRVYAQTKDEVKDQNRLLFYGDFRGRLELDRNSDKPDGSSRQDRDRLRVRGRLGVNYEASEHVSLGLRLRTGNPASRQSPHVTLGDDFSTFRFQADKLFGRVQFDGGSAWFGKNSNPFWHENELFWDDDVTLEGLAASYQLLPHLQGRAGYFVLDTPTSNNFSDQARMIGGQLVFQYRNLVGALGVRAFRSDVTQSESRLDSLDYTFLTANLYNTFIVDRVPVRVGVDVISNLEDYESAMLNHDQTFGFVASIRAGNNSNIGDLQVRYYYAHIEKYAVIGSFAQDDWVRWGSSTTTRSSNFQGHEVSAVYVIGRRQNLMVRVFVVDGVEKENPQAVRLESGTRFRLDWNIGF